jgi:hypothetical protein
MTELSFSLSASGLRNIQSTLYSNDFVFMIGKETFSCPSFIAEFLSPKVSRLRAADPTVQEFSIDIPDSGPVFCDILSLGKGSSVEVTEMNRKLLESICCSLGNVEFLNSIFHSFEGELKICNVSDRLRILSEIEVNCEEELEFAASHFHEITKQSDSEFLKVKEDVVYQMISRDSLKLESEDQLWNFIRTWSQKQNDSDFESRSVRFLEFVKLEYLSFETMKEVISAISESLPSLNSAVWTSLQSRLLLSVSLPPTFCDRYSSVTHHSVGNDPLSGIVAFLTRKHGGNVHDLGIVTVTVSSHPSNTTDQTIRKRILDLTTTDHAWTRWDAPNQWFCCDFKTSWIRPTDYAIRAEPNPSNLQHWVIEGSVNGIEWIELDQRRDNTDLKTALTTKVFSITNSHPVRQIRIRQTGPNHNSNHCLALTAFEVFGDLDESSN